MFNIEKYREIEVFLEKKTSNKVTIVCISKNHPIEAVILAIKHGVKVFGENRVQEAISKFSKIKETNKDIQLHLTGPLQTNKVSSALSIFDCFQTLDREKLAREFCKYPDIIKKKKFFIQVNIGEEDKKSGIMPGEANKFIDYCKNDLKFNIVGLMCIPPINQNPNSFFLNLKNIANQNNIKNLSMGMSGDYKEGVEGGATYIRLGTILFGNRV